MKHSSNICHFDIKPENIFIKNSRVAKLGDFGFAQNYKQINSKKAKNIWKNRSKLYMAPEILEIIEIIEKKEVLSEEKI